MSARGDAGGVYQWRTLEDAKAFYSGPWRDGIVERYGMTETHGIITANSSRFYLAKPASCGPVVPVLDYKLVDEEGNDLPMTPDTTGVLCVRGSIVETAR